MSGRESTNASSASQPTTTAPKRMVTYHSDFCSTTADFIVQSSDAVRFKCHRLFLEEASPVFRTMLSLPQPSVGTSTSTSSGSHDLIEVPEDGMTLETLLRLIYPTCECQCWMGCSNAKFMAFHGSRRSAMTCHQLVIENSC